VYSISAENKRGRIGKPGQFLETGITIHGSAAGPTAGRSDDFVTLPVGPES
jgi:hypothetical protein